MTDHTCHRNLLSAAKLLLLQFEARCRSSPHGVRMEDWAHIVRTERAIADSKNALEIAGNSRKGYAKLDTRAV